MYLGVCTLLPTTNKQMSEKSRQITVSVYELLLTSVESFTCNKHIWDRALPSLSAVPSTRGRAWCHVHTPLHTSSRHQCVNSIQLMSADNYLFQWNLILVLPFRVSQFTSHALSISGTRTTATVLAAHSGTCFISKLRTAHLNTTSSQRHAHQSGTGHRCPLNQVLPLTFHYF